MNEEGERDGADQTSSTATTRSGTPAVHTVDVGPGGSLVFDPDEVQIAPGNVVRWEWKTSTHNIDPDAAHGANDWRGTEGGDDTFYDEGHVHEHTFDEPGVYDYACVAHEPMGMRGTVVVGDAERRPLGDTVVLSSTPSIDVGPDDDAEFVPGTDPVAIVRPGTEVTFVWRSDGHSIVVDDQPQDAAWEGTGAQDAGHEHTHEFRYEGRYEFHCSAHPDAPGGTIVVEATN
ncbi:plastocyanin/azurin family copper-binding protein [Halobacterium wangiae]|uniref:plastocyanin/azurin family copper-binding protein n=1 Tax=Halobacterium wangiae TaxID=2902623 RepID=UPI001E436BAC|nr:plastocyanin/azurin family copper-binding protein [Halobacterium wangiae]